MNSRKPKLNVDIGCGENVQAGFVGMDKRPLETVDVVHDAEVFPWPFEDGEASVVMMSHFVEHVKPWFQIDLINECWRILEDNGLLLIATPYGGSFRYNQDPTHCSPWNEATVEYFVEGTPLFQVYKPKPWKMEKRTWYVLGDLEVALRKIGGEKTNGSLETELESAMEKATPGIDSDAGRNTI